MLPAFAAAEIPVLRRKLSQVLEAQDVIEGSHDYKSLVAVFETFPKDDLFAMEVSALSDTLGELVETEDVIQAQLMEALIAPERLADAPPESAPALEEQYRELTPEELQNLRNLPYIGG